MKRTPLPKASDLDGAIIEMKGWDMSDDQIGDSASDHQQAAPMPSLPATPHPLVEVARHQLQAAQPDHDGLLHTDPATAPDLRVSAPMVDRCLEILHALITRWEASGGSIGISAQGSGKRPTTTIGVGQDAFCLHITEEINESKPITDPARRIGRLAVWITGDERQEFRRRWSETKSQRFEKILKPLIDTLLRAIDVKKMERLDAECVKRQEKKVEQRRNALARDENREFYWRQSLTQFTDRWHEARRIREFLVAFKQAVDSGQWRFADEKTGKEWLEWASGYADSIDPLTAASGPRQEAEGPIKTAVAELDLTSRGRATVSQLQVKDTDELWKVAEDQIRKMHAPGSVWNEINRVLEGLGYDISKREKAVYW